MQVGDGSCLSYAVTAAVTGSLRGLPGAWWAVRSLEREKRGQCSPGVSRSPAWVATSRPGTPVLEGRRGGLIGGRGRLYSQHGHQGELRPLWVGRVVTRPGLAWERPRAGVAELPERSPNIPGTGGSTASHLRRKSLSSPFCEMVCGCT